MNILITGANGQLGNEMRLVSEKNTQHSYFFTDVDTLDITDMAALNAYVQANAINCIVNCAAYTAVDKAEDDEELCYKINAQAVQNLGEVAEANQALMIHVSTDYVFDGTGHKPYTEDMDVCPTNVYGRSKLAGEQLLLKACPNAVVVRTSWLYSSFGNNFVKTMMRLGAERDALNVIFDQVGTPTYAADLAEAIFSIIATDKIVPGIFHFSNEGVCSWYDFTISILKNSGITCAVSPIESAAYPVRTPRPHYSVLNKAKIKSAYNIEIPHWETSLVQCINRLQCQPQ